MFVRFLAWLGMRRVFSALTLERLNDYAKQNEVHHDHRPGSARAAQDAFEDVLRFSR
jgi:hypothetical protein